MKLITIIKSAAMVLIFFTGCSPDTAVDTAAVKKEKLTAVVLSGGTVIRIHPYLYSAKVDELNKAAVVSIIDKSSEKQWIGKSNDYWYKVKTSDSISGWVFGQNLKILDSADSSDSESFAKEVQEKELQEIKKEISGKWWSVNKFDDFTNHCLELHGDGRYHSYFKGSEKGIEGEYNVDFTKNELIFLKGTTFKSDLNFVKRGQTYTLHRETDEGGIKMKKILSILEEKKAAEGGTAESTPEPEQDN